MTQEELDKKLAELSAKILEISRNAIFLDLRFLTKAVTHLVPTVYSGSLAVDGKRLYYAPKYVIKRYKIAERLPIHDYLHLVLHCVFRHWNIYGDADQKRWNAACDIAVESLIIEIGLQCNENIAEKNRVLALLSSKMRPITAEKLYAYFKGLDDAVIDEYAAVFCVDDHKLWYKAQEKEYEPEEKQKTLGLGYPDDKTEKNDDPADNEGAGVNDKKEKNGDENTDDTDGASTKGEKDGENTADNGTSAAASDEYKDTITEFLNSEDHLDNARQNELKQLEKMWRDIAKQIQMELGHFVKNAGKESQNMIQALEEVNRERYDYTEFLKKFAVRGEVMRLDDENFDINYYCYGLALSDGLALIEPLEHKEEKRIRDMVIAIDTSGSVSGAVVQNFVQKTYNILCSENSFFKKVNIYIIQCDTEIREAVKITCREEFDKYLKNMELKGLGGTDFRPVFNYVDELVNKKELANLKGLIYFTDGYGEFPQKKPPYDTAFVFMRTDYETAANPEVPAWAIKLILEETDI